MTLLNSMKSSFTAGLQQENSLDQSRGDCDDEEFQFDLNQFDGDDEIDDLCSPAIDESQTSLLSTRTNTSSSSSAAHRPPTMERQNRRRAGLVTYLLIATALHAVVNLSYSIAKSVTYSSDTTANSLRNLKNNGSRRFPRLATTAMRTRVRGTTILTEQDDDSFGVYAPRTARGKSHSKPIDMSIFDKDNIIDRDQGAVDGEFGGALKLN